MSWSVTLWVSVVLTLTSLTTSQYRQSLHNDTDDVATAVDSGVLERFLLQRARVEAVKRGILQQLGLTEAPRPPAAQNASSPAASVDDDGRRAIAAYRRTVAQTRHRVVSNDVVDDVTGNDVNHADAPSARQFYSFKGHGKLYRQQEFCLNGYVLRCSGQYWSNPPFLIFWYSGTLALSPERQSARMSKIKNYGLDQYGAERFGRIIFCHNQKKCGNERV